MVASLNADDLEDTMEIASISGEIAVISDVLAELDMETMSDFLLSRSMRLRELAVDNIMRYGAIRALTETMEDVEAEIAELGENEMAEGSARLDLADAAAASSEAMAAAGEEMIAEGLATLAAAQGALDAAEELGD